MSKENENETWTGVSLSSLPRFGPGSSLSSQYPLDKLPNDDQSSLTPQGLSQPFEPQDSWDGYHVRLPWSKNNLYPGWKDEKRLMKSKWELIKNTLRTRSIQSSHDLQETIVSCNPKYRGHEDWSFSTLHKLMSENLSQEESNKFFNATLPKMINILLSSDSTVTSPVPLLTSGKSQSIALTQEQASVLLVNAFFCTYPLRNARGMGDNFPNFPRINFNTLFSRGHSRRGSEAKLQELKCLIHYFTRITESTPSGVLVFSRIGLTSKNVPDWGKSKKKMSKLHITSEGSIESEGQGMLQVDFANKFLGGGVLTYGMAQEEIRFSVCPELIVSRLFTEALADNEVLLMLGAEQFSKYQGYSNTFTYDGPFNDMTDLDEQGIKKTAIVAMDAKKVSYNGQLQFDTDKVDRELNKAYIGFINHGAVSGQLQAVATGNWGCGAFGGDVRLKFLIQLMAVSENMRDMAYFTFGDKTLVSKAGKMHKLLVKKGVTVGQLYKIILEYCQKSGTKSGEELYQDIFMMLEKNDKCTLS